MGIVGIGIRQGRARLQAAHAGPERNWTGRKWAGRKWASTCMRLRGFFIVIWVVLPPTVDLVTVTARGQSSAASPAGSTHTVLSLQIPARHWPCDWVRCCCYQVAVATGFRMAVVMLTECANALATRSKRDDVNPRERKAPGDTAAKQGAWTAGSGCPPSTSSGRR